MKKPVTIVVLSKYWDVLQPFLDSLKFVPQQNPLIQDIAIVVDGPDIAPVNLSGGRITIIPGPEKFSMAGNGNIGLMAVSAENDILYCGDDIRFLEPNTIEKLQEAAYSDPNIGLLSPRLIGRGSSSQVNPKPGISEVRPLEMWFPCIYIKREVIEKVGYLDEQFNDFGSDDLDYCIRVKLAGYKLAVTSNVAVKHQASPEGGPTTFCRNIGVEEYQKQQDVSIEKLRNKYKVSQNTLSRCLSTGDCELLRNPEKTAEELGSTPDHKEAMAYLKTRSLFLATPAYGGQFSVNYVNSLVQLLNILHDVGIKYVVKFMYNESLITRARNVMATSFLRETECTDFFFIDADIGFDAREIVSLMLRPEGVIGAPCVRKNLRLDRIATAIKKNGREYSIDDMQKLAGEFVINFPPDAAPENINLGQILEVQDVGTGLMRIRREVFEQVEKAYPDQWYLPMNGEEGKRLPIYMYFQSAMDPETKKYNPGGYPDYISEDYYFCRLCRKIGIKVYLAPWIKTSHMGAYVFQGDMVAVAEAGGSLR